MYPLVHGTLIGDSSLLRHEILFLKNKYQGAPVVAIKVNLNKAYDRLECDFIEAVPRQVGFQELWISLTMNSITTVSYSILVNCKPFASF